MRAELIISRYGYREEIKLLRDVARLLLYLSVKLKESD